MAVTIFSASDLRRKLKDILDSVGDSDNIIVIRRPSGKKDIALVPLEEWNKTREIVESWNQWQETLYLMHSGANHEWIIESIRQVQSGETTERALEIT